MSKKRKRPVNGPFFRQWRKSRELTQDQLAEKMGIEQGTLSRLERGDIAYTQETLEAFAAGVGCQPADLFAEPTAENELSRFIGSLDERTASKALRILKSALDDEAA